MKVSKSLLCQFGPLVGLLNLAIGANGIKLWGFMEEVSKVVEPFLNFRNKLVHDLGINDETKGADPKVAEAEQQLNEFAVGEVDLKNVRFLSEEEFKKAVAPLFENASYLPMAGINVLKDLLCKEKGKK